jgi:GNAT superfamily N-acetyltransferase
MSEFTIKHISALQTIDLRTRILRPGQPIEICHYPEDNLSSTFHLGIFHGDRIVANGTFMQFAHKDFPEARNPYRLRGMASDFEYQGQGLGSMILQNAEMILKSMNCDLLWFNAREKAFRFYEKNGFLITGNMFDIAGAGPHKVMYKWL